MKWVIFAWIWSKSLQEAGYSVLSRSKIQVSMLPKTRSPAAGTASPLAGPDQRSGPRAVGEQFEQDRVRHAAIENHGGVDPAIDRLQAGFDLWDHASGNNPVGDHPTRPAGRHLRDRPIVGVEHAGNVGQQQKSRRFDR